MSRQPEPETTKNGSELSYGGLVRVVSRLHGRYGIVAIIPVSSKPGRHSVDVALARWSAEGLALSSVGRVGRITTMLQSDLVAELGRLGADDEVSLQEALRSYLLLK